jgi:hypothetical protein
MNNDDPLKNLLVSESQAVDKLELSNLLSPYLLINKESQTFDFIGKFWDLPNSEKILIILAGIKARSLIFGIEDKITPSEIIKMDVAPEGSIKITLKNLLESKDIKSEKSKYYLPNYKIPQVVERLKKITSK